MRLVGLAAAAPEDPENESAKLVALILERDGKAYPGNGKPADDKTAEPAAPAEIPLPELPQVLQPDADDQLDLQQLESHLWEAADILRGKIDSSDFKHYIFGLLFYKRLCDVWEEEYEERLARVRATRSSPPTPTSTASTSPRSCFWQDVRQEVGGHRPAPEQPPSGPSRTPTPARRASSRTSTSPTRSASPTPPSSSLLQHFEKLPAAQRRRRARHARATPTST